MIRSITSLSATVHPTLVPPSVKSAPAVGVPQIDRLSTDTTTFLRTEVLREPEVRAEVVARARALAADPSYPSMAVMKDIAGQILRSPDLSEDMS